MLRKVFLEGELARRFGDVVTLNAPSIKDVFLVLEANDPTIKNYISECALKGVSFSIQVADTFLEEEEDLLLPIKQGDVFISVVPAGSKSGGAKIFGAILIAALFVVSGGTAAAAMGLTTTTAATATAAATTSLTLAGTMVASLGINLALAGLQQMMAPDPSVDQGQEESYLFNGQNQNIIEGDPVPIAYGRVRVPGRPISFDVINDRIYFSGWSNAELHSVSSTGETYTGLMEDILGTDSDGNHKRTLPESQDIE